MLLTWNFWTNLKNCNHAVFRNVETGDLKSIECVRVDEAADKGLSHEEVQFWWTGCHVAKWRQVTLVTTRSS